MPLVSSQNIIHVAARGGGTDEAIKLLKERLAKERERVRVIAIDVKDIPNPLGRGSLGTSITAVVELAPPLPTPTPA